MAQGVSEGRTGGVTAKPGTLRAPSFGGSKAFLYFSVGFSLPPCGGASALWLTSLVSTLSNPLAMSVRANLTLVIFLGYRA